MEPRVVLLDLDGPLLDVRERYFRAHLHAADGLRVARLEPEAYWKAKRAQTPLAALLDVAPDSAALARYRERWTAAIEDPDLLALDRLQPGARDALARLAAVPRRVLVSMRTAVDAARVALDRLELRRYFSQVEIVPHAVGTKTAAFRAWGSPETPDDTVAIGDTEIDVEAAQALGFTAIAVSCGIRTRERLLALRPHAVVDDLSAAVDWIAAHERIPAMHRGPR